MSLSKKLFRLSTTIGSRTSLFAKRNSRNAVRKIVIESLERRELMAANVFNDQFNLTNGSLVYSPPIALNVLTNDNDGAFTQQVSAANIDYTNPNKAGNTATYSIPLRPSSTTPQRSLIVGGITLGNVTNYADIAISKDSDSLDNGTGSLTLLQRTEGVVIATIRENITPNLPGNTATNLAVLNYNTENLNVQLSSEAGPANDAENIVRPAVTRFPFAANWIGGSYSNAGVAVVSHPSITVATTAATGQYQVSIAGVSDSRADGFLFVMASGNSDNYARALPIGGSNWLVNTRDNAGNLASGENAAFSVLYVPRSAQGLVGGVIRGDSGIANPVIQSFGDFSIQRTSNGNWNLSIPGQSPSTGMLIIETADQDRARATNSYFSYQAAANGTDFSIRQLQFESATAANALNDDFVVLFVPFENQLATASPLTVSAMGTTSTPNSGLSANGIALTVNADNTVNYAYTPEQLRALPLGQTVTDTFVYTATDGIESSTATVTVTLRGSNDAPIVTAAISPIVFTEDGAAQTINLGTYLLDYDSNDTLVYAITLSADAPVDATIVGSNLTFTPKPDRSGAFSYTVRLTDSSGLSVTSAVAVGSISSVVDGAKAVNDFATTTKDSPIEINVLGNDFDPENGFGSVGAANVSGNITATSDATTTWAIAQTSAAPNNLNVVGAQNLGDVQLSQNGVNLQQSMGVLLATVSDDTTPFGTVNSAGNILNATAGYVLATDTGTGTGGERNTPLGAAFFPYADLWTSGHVDNTGVLRSGVGVSQSNVTRIAAGLFEVTIPEATNSETSGFLFAMTASNDDNILSIRPIPGTNRWMVRNTDNDSAPDTAGVANLEDDGFSFVYIPATTANLVGGRWAIDSTSGVGSLVQASGGVTATTDLSGTLTVSIPGQSTTTGTLIAIGSGGVAATVAGNSIVLPANLAVSYVASGSDFSIRLRSGGTFAQSIGEVQFIFLPFANALEKLAPNPYSVTSANATSAFGAAITLNANGTIMYDPTSAGGSIAALNPGESLQDTFTYTITDSNGRTSTATANVTVTGDRVVVSPFTGLSTTEAGGTAQFSVSLAVPPTADVTIAFATSDATEGLPSVSSVTFTTTNWNTPQTVTITGVDDAVVDGNIAYNIVTTATSADTNFNGVSVVDLSVVNNDNDVAGITVTPTAGLITTERGGTATFSVVLTSEPVADVVIALSSSNTAEGTVAPSSLTFTSANWNVPQVVTVTGVDDALVDADIAYSIITDAAVSNDPLYSGRNPANVALVNTNFDIGAATSSGITQYGSGSAGIGIDGRIVFAGTSAFLTNGTLTVSVTGNPNANDRLEVRNEGTGAGQVGVSGADITFAGLVIGSFAGGVGTPLVITFNATATRVSAQFVARAVTYRDVTVNGFGTRTINFALVDGGGQASPVVSKLVNIGLKRVFEIQEGVDRGFGTYIGAKDIQLSQNSPNSSFPTGGDANGLLVDYPDAGSTNTTQVLMRFENLFGTALGQIPAGAIITSASLFLQMNNTGDGAEFHRMLSDWNPTTSTWSNIGGGIQLDDNQARSSYDSFWNTLDVSGATGAGYASVAVTNDLRAWNAGATNFGWALTPFLGGTDGWAFSASESVDPTVRPMLKIEWVPAGTSTVAFQQGLNSYAGTVDTHVFQAAPAQSFGTQATIGSDYEDAGGANRTQALVRFEDIMGNATGRIPVNARIDQAVLTLVSGSGNAVGHGGSFNAMLTDWNQDSTWDSLVNGVSANDIEARSAITTQAGNSTLTPLAQAGINDFDVSPDVQNWVRGTANKGWAILPWTNGSDGWFFYTSEYTGNAAYRPALQVFFTELPNSAPTDILLSPAVVDENLPVDSIVGSLSSVDPDAGNTFTYELVAGAGDTDNNSFKIVNGQILTNAIFDFESKSSYTIRVRTTDQGGQIYAAQTFEKSMTIGIGNINENLLASTPVVTPSSLSVRFSKALDVTKLNLVDSNNVNGATDVTLVGATLGAVKGSVVLDADGKGFTFVKSGGPIAADSYTLTLRSAANGFVDTAGGLLDGNADGTAGDDYVHTFTVNAIESTTTVLSVGDFERGAGQAVNLPANTTNGLPITISTGVNITGASFDLNYNPALLTITGGTTSIAGATVTVDTATAGVARVTVTSAAQFSAAAGALTLVNLLATVPTTAPLGTKAVLRFSNVSLTAADASALASATDAGLLVSAYKGDVNNSNSITTGDVTGLLRSLSGALSTTGFPTFKLADPTIIGDMNDSSSLTTGDATGLLRFISGAAGGFPAIPALPLGLTPTFGADPQIFIPQTLTVTAGNSIQVPINVRVTEPSGVSIAGVDVSFTYDASRYTIGAITTGAALAGFTFSSSNNTTTAGVARLVYASDVGPAFANGFVGTLLNVTLTARADAAPGASAINLTRAGASDNDTNDLTIAPAITTGVDSSDGVITIPGGANGAPTALALSPSTVAENAGANATVGTFTTTDPDSGDTFTYTLVTGTGATDNASFNISGSTLRAAASLDFETKSSYSVRVRTTDAGGLFFESPFTITVTNVNETPVFNPTTYTFSLPENSATGTAIGTVVVTDVDAGTTLTYTLTGTGAANFAISSTGAITVAAGAVLNFEGTNTWSLTATASDGSLSATAPVTINLTNVNEAPSFSPVSYTFSLPENSAAGTVVGTVVATDPDAGATLTYSLTGVDAANFTINAATGEIRVATGAVLNFEVTSQYSLSASVSDGTLTATAGVTINVTNVNETPVFAPPSYTFTLPENSASGTAVGTVVATDPEGATLTYTLTGTGSSLFAISSTGAITVAAGAVLNFEGTRTWSLTATASDGSLSATAPVTINLTNVNEAPVFNPTTYTFSLPENSATGTAVGTVIATDVDAGTTLTYTLTGTGSSLFAISSTGAITVAAGASFNAGTTPSYDLTATVSDGALTSTAPVRVNITAVVAAPQLTSVVVNGGDTFSNPTQRSEITSLVVTFNKAVTVSAGAFSIVDNGLLTAQSPVALAQSQILVTANAANTVFTIRFGSGPGVNTRTGAAGSGRGNSLADGNFVLSIDPTRVTDGTNNLSPTNSVGNGDNQFGDQATDAFFRMFGDSNGDGVVSTTDTGAFRAALANNDAAFDFDGDGLVLNSGVDRTNFLGNFGKRRR